MRILLFSDINSDSQKYFPLNLIGLEASLSLLGVESVVLDGQLSPEWKDYISKYGRSYDAIFISSYTGPSYRSALDAAKLFKKRNPKGVAVLGGYQSLGNVAKSDFFDVVSRGFAELNIYEICEYISENRQLADVPNVVGSKVAPTKAKKSLSIPHYNYRCVPADTYINSTKLRVMQFVSSYGCPFACSYCAEPSHSKRSWVSIDPLDLSERIERIEQEFDVARISFVDPNFSTDIGRVIEFFDLERSRGNRSVEYHANMRSTDIVRIEETIGAKFIRDGGMAKVFVGMESGSDRMLRRVMKKTSAEQNYASAKFLTTAGISIQASFMFDLPGEQKGDVDATFDLIHSICELVDEYSHLSFHFIAPLPGTEFSQHIQNSEKLDWGGSDTFGSSPIRRGNRELRTYVKNRLHRLSCSYPDSVRKREVDRLTI